MTLTMSNFGPKAPGMFTREHREGRQTGTQRKVKKCGRLEKETPDDDCDSLEPNTIHIYLETEDGVPVSKALVTQQG
jgi:hypothetical protein